MRFSSSRRDRARARAVHLASSAPPILRSSLAAGRYPEALAHLEQALTIARRIGNRVGEWFALSEMTYALTMLGRWQEAFARLAEIPDELIGKDMGLLSPANGILEIYLRRGKLDEARRLLGRIEGIGRSGDAQAVSCYHAALAAVRSGEGDYRDALVAAEQAFSTREPSASRPGREARFPARARGGPRARRRGEDRRAARGRRGASARPAPALPRRDRPPLPRPPRRRRTPAPTANSRPPRRSFAPTSSPSTSPSSSSSTPNG